jgi:hypothetical protein
MSLPWDALRDAGDALTPSLWVSLASTHSFDESKGAQLCHFQAMLRVRATRVGNQTNKQTNK